MSSNIIFKQIIYINRGDIIKKFLISSLITILIFLGISLITSIINYFGFIPDTVNKIIIYLLYFACILFISYNIGSLYKKNGILQGFKVFSIIMIITSFIGLIIDYNYNLKIIIYDIIICLTTIFGSILGVNKKIHS